MKIQMDGCVVKIRTLLNKRRYMVHVIVFFWRDNIRRTHSIISIIDHNLCPSSFIQQAQRNNNDNMATIRARELYNDIIEDYSAIKSNRYKRWIEEYTFLKAIVGNNDDGIRNKSVLDLGCGSGHFCRLINNRADKYGAATVSGIDISDAMIDEAKRLEEKEPTGTTYYRADLLAEEDQSDDSNDEDISKLKVDICVAAFLLPYASSIKELQKFCTSAARTLRPGGRFISVTSLYTDSIKAIGLDNDTGDGGGGVLTSDTWGFSVVWDEEATNDGMLADITLFGNGRKDRVTFPNYLWTKETINSALLAAGFDRVEWLSPTIDANITPDDITAEFQKDLSEVVPTVGYFVATLAM
jgi:SAM-dependent methyltransferase